MARIYIFGDESGNLDFSGNIGATKYFLVTTVAMDSCDIGNDLLELKRELHWNDYQVNDYFHAVDDRQVVRDNVFNFIGKRNFRVDSTILEKAKAMPHLAKDEMRFYKQAWYLHLKYVVPKVTSQGDEVFIVAASFGTKARKTAARSALGDVIAQVATGRDFQLACWPASTDPCLQVADYCCWAIQRKWERSDTRSHTLISSKIQTEFDAFASDKICY
ncbi:MAG: DUF3800 domain-containing protein [Armatimonadota bacterium]